MKKKIIVWSVIAIVSILIIAISYKPKTSVTIDAPFIDNAQYCFVYTHEATDTDPYAVEEHLMLTHSNGIISGTKKGTQHGPDMTNGYVGTVLGTTDGETLRLVYSYTVEGSNNKEAEIYSVIGTSIVKHRYVLREGVQDGEKMLLPDIKGNQILQMYTSEKCTEQ